MSWSLDEISLLFPIAVKIERFSVLISQQVKYFFFVVRKFCWLRYCGLIATVNVWQLKLKCFNLAISRWSDSEFHSGRHTPLECCECVRARDDVIGRRMKYIHPTVSWSEMTTQVHSDVNRILLIYRTHGAIETNRAIPKSNNLPSMNSILFIKCLKVIYCVTHFHTYQLSTELEQRSMLWTNIAMRKYEMEIYRFSSTFQCMTMSVSTDSMQ